MFFAPSKNYDLFITEFYFLKNAKKKLFLFSHYFYINKILDSAPARKKHILTQNQNFVKLKYLNTVKNIWWIKFSWFYSIQTNNMATKKKFGIIFQQRNRAFIWEYQENFITVEGSLKCEILRNLCRCN